MTPASLLGTIVPSPALLGVLTALGLLPFFIPILLWRLARAIFHGAR